MKEGGAAIVCARRDLVTTCTGIWAGLGAQQTVCRSHLHVICHNELKTI